MHRIALFRRYQRWLLWGGGLALSVMIVAASVLAIWSSIKDYIGEGRSVYLRHKALLLLVIETKQAALRRGVINAEMLWSDRRRPKQTLLNDFSSQGCRAVIQINSKVLPQLSLGEAKGKCPVNVYADYLALAGELAYTLSASVQARRMPVSIFFYNLDHTFITIAPPPPNDLVNLAAGEDVSGLIRRLAPDIGNFRDPVIARKFHESRRIIWLPAWDDLFTGEKMFRLVIPAFDEGHAFIVFVSSLGSNALSDVLNDGDYDGNFLILDSQGRQILSVRGDQSVDHDLPRRVLASQSWKKNLQFSDHYYEAGDFTFSEPLSDTGWIFAYTYSWRTILAARWPILLAYGGGSLIMLSVLWGFLWSFDRKVFMPTYRHSQRVFESEELSRTIIATAPVGLSLLSVKGDTLLKNDVMRSYDDEAISLQGKFLNLYWRNLGGAGNRRGNRFIEQDLAITAADGTESHLLVNLVETKYQSEDVLLCSVSNITTRKLLERKLEEARIAADIASQTKSSFLATMSHEIRTPLNAILGNLELLERTELTELQADRLRTVSSSSKALLTIINDILDFSKAESGQMTIENIDFDVLDVIEQVALVFAPLADAKGLGLFYTMPPDMPRHYRGDPARLRQVLLNLLSNAIKFTESGKVTIWASSLAGGSGPPVLTISVSDSGIGITAPQRLALFQPFIQGDTSISRRFGGTGLGLALCKRLIELMGGTIALDVSDAAGSIFTIRLPLQLAGNVQKLHNAFPDFPTVVLLCSAPEWREFIGEQLRYWGIQVNLISDPAEMPAMALPLLIFGGSRSWSFADENLACDKASWVIDVAEDGPRKAVTRGRRTALSCYCLDGLRNAIALALVPEEGAADAAPGQPTETNAFAIPAVRTLVVEDHKINLALIHDQFATLGYPADLANSGQAALALFEKNQYDMVFTDLNMSGMDGYMLTTSLRRRGTRLPIIAITAHAGPEERQRCKQIGITDVLLKPMSLAQIDQMVRKHCGGGTASFHSPNLSKPVLSKALLQTMRVTNTDSIAMIYRALATNDFAQMQEQLHSIKGVFAMIGETAVVAVCRRMEHLASTADVAALTESVPKFDAMLDEVLCVLEQTAQ